MIRSRSNNSLSRVAQYSPIGPIAFRKRHQKATHPSPLTETILEEPQAARENPCRAVSHAETVIALILTCIVLYFHIIVLMNAGGLWRDEINNFSLAAMPLNEMWERLQYTSIPALSVVLTHAWMSTSWGASDFGLRVFGFIIGISIIAMLWYNARLTGIGVPLVSLLLLGFNAGVVRWGDSLRPYGLSMLFSLWSFGMIWIAIKAPRVQSMFMATLVAILSVHTMYPNSFNLLGVCCAAGVLLLRRALWTRGIMPICIGMLAALSLFPYIPAIRSAFLWHVIDQSPITLTSVLIQLSRALGSPSLFMFPVWVVLFVLGSVSGLTTHVRSKSIHTEDVGQFAAVTILLSTLGFFGIWISAARYATHPWNYLPILAPLALCLEVSLFALIKNTYARILRLLLVISIAFALLMPMWNRVQVRQTNVDLVAAKLEALAMPDDLIVVVPFQVGITFMKYYHGLASWTTIPPVSDLSIHRYDLLKLEMVKARPLEPVFRQMKEALQAGSAVWLIGNVPTLEQGEIVEPLPPAPSAGTWYHGTYIENWTKQTGYFLQAHAVTITSIPVPCDIPINPFENMPVSVARGWKE